ncbi:hypothetical protein VVAX_06105 [Variovorax paradoxus]|uniref:Uncharacterized protein n=1 Tax=Variovorax paradoxus TaxID=34073 RepID=A0A679JUD7_VARPD|nr:hypothetical protein VVAX_06105 [Variovorax paradoxus]
MPTPPAGFRLACVVCVLLHGRESALPSKRRFLPASWPAARCAKRSWLPGRSAPAVAIVSVPVHFAHHLRQARVHLAQRLHQLARLVAAFHANVRAQVAGGPPSRPLPRPAPAAHDAARDEEGEMPPLTTVRIVSSSCRLKLRAFAASISWLMRSMSRRSIDNRSSTGLVGLGGQQTVRPEARAVATALLALTLPTSSFAAWYPARSSTADRLVGRLFLVGEQRRLLAPSPWSRCPSSRCRR